PEWSKFVTDVKLAKDMHNVSFDQLYAYFRQRKAHANEVRMMRKRFLDPLALVANTYNSPPLYTSHPSQYNPHFLAFPSQQQFYTPLQQQQTYEAPVVQQQAYDPPVVHQQAYEALAVQ
ncbi:hypothetical protein Tco_1397042, partial [Tanacetum coccineum]